MAVIVGKIVRWLSDLKNVAFSGEAKDLSTDSAHRFTTDDEKTAWNGKAAGSHRHPASQVDEEADKRFLTDAERVKIADTYTKAQSDTTNTNVLQGAKDYTDSAVSGAKSHTDNAFAQVYKKNETYTREEINTGDAGTLALAREYASQKIAEVVGSSPEALNTLYELAAALNNDPNFATSIMALISGKADSWHQHTRAQITDFPSSMPASDVYDWAKQPDKPGYSPAEVGAAPASHNHSRSQITDFPSSLPASDVYEWAKQPGKPGYTPGEVGAAPANHGHTASQITEEVDKRFMTDAERSKLANIETAGEWMELQVSATGNANTAYYLWIKVLNGYFILKFGGDWTAGARPQDPFVVSNFNFGVLPQSVIYISAYYGDGASAISVRKFTFVFAGHAIYIRNVDHIEDETGFSPEGEFMFPIPQDGAFGPVI